MQLIRFGNKGNEKPGIMDDNNKRRDASALRAEPRSLSGGRNEIDRPVHRAERVRLA